MNAITVEYSAVIDAAPQTIYAILRDYDGGHRAILPKPYFQSMDIEAGGVGAGTVLNLTVNIYGQSYHYHQVVSEPEPGRILMEKDMDTGQWSRFVIDPLEEGRRSRVTIESEFPATRGLMGWLQRWTLPPVARRIYAEELAQLAAYVRGDLNVSAKQSKAAHA